MAHVWITNYLYDRKQCVSFNKLDSPYEKVNCGVPQGSILVPLLFLMYIHDLCNVEPYNVTIRIMYPVTLYVWLHYIYGHSEKRNF